MMSAKPRVNQWVVCWDTLEVGKVEETLRKYHRYNGKEWGPVEKVYVRQRDGQGWWHPVESIKIILPSEAMSVIRGTPNYWNY